MWQHASRLVSLPAERAHLLMARAIRDKASARTAAVSCVPRCAPLRSVCSPPVANRGGPLTRGEQRGERGVPTSMWAACVEGGGVRRMNGGENPECSAHREGEERVAWLLQLLTPRVAGDGPVGSGEREARAARHTPAERALAAVALCLCSPGEESFGDL